MLISAKGRLSTPSGHSLFPKPDLQRLRSAVAGERRSHQLKFQQSVLVLLRVQPLFCFASYAAISSFSAYQQGPQLTYNKTRRSGFWLCPGF